MSHVATLIVDPATPVLNAGHLSRAAALLPAPGEPRWLAPGVAADIPFAPPVDADNPALAGAVRAALVEALRAALAPEPVDVVVQPVVGRRKALLVADMDSTLIQQECIDELADALGLREPVAAITERSMRGEVDFETSLRERVALLRGLDLEAALAVMAERITFMPGGAILARTMGQNGAVTAIVSGGFTIFTDRVAAALGFGSHFANTLVVADGKLTGTVEEPILGRESKRTVLLGLRYAHGLAPLDTMAVGDGANDLAMLGEAGLGVAFHAKPAVAAAAKAQIVHGDLTALLYLQGYTSAEFVG